MNRTSTSTSSRSRSAGRGTRIQSLERATEILSYFRVSRPHLSLQEITARSGLSRATAHRYVSVLRDLDLLRLDPVSNTYTLGTRVLTLAAAAAAGHPMILMVGPFMEELVRTTNETAVLTVWDGTAPVVLRVDDGTERVVRVSVQTGVRLPTWDSAHGRAFCANLPDEEIPSVPSPGRADELSDHLEQVRRTGVSINTNEEQGTRAVAAPIFSNGGDVVASIGIVGTAASVPGSFDSDIARAVVEVAGRISAELGVSRSHRDEPASPGS